MNFADKVKEIYEGNTEEDVDLAFEPETFEFTAQLDVEKMKKLIPVKELMPSEIFTAGLEALKEGLSDPEIAKDKEFVTITSRMLLRFLSDVVERLFDCKVYVDVTEIKTEEEEDE